MTPMTPKLFSKTIEDIVKDKKVNHMDAIVIFCEKNDVEENTEFRIKWPRGEM